MQIIGYAYDADIHCTECANGAGMDRPGVVDSEGNEPHPVFSIDEPGESGCDHCGDCFDPLNWDCTCTVETR